ncbi:MAG: hypothetical protein ACERKN_16425 [Velocimicrobium sp.]
MIAGVTMSGQISGLYPQYNTNKIQSIKKIQTAEPQESPLIDQKQEEQSSVSLSEELKNAKTVSYTSNPYEQSRKIAENSLLVGQNLDIAV